MNQSCKIIPYFLFFATCCVLSFGRTERWVYRYNGFADSSDIATCVVYGDDNIYAAGGCSDSIGGADFLVISITLAGDEKWVYRFDSTGRSGIANSIQYGDDGYVYCAGSYFFDTTRSDFIVVSLDTSGIQQWIYRYNGPGNGDDRATLLRYGADNNIYVIGDSRNLNTSGDITLVSLTSSGDERWVYRHNGSADWHDEARSLVYGHDDNIYVAGSSWNIGTFIDFTVISLDTAGNERWIYEYNGPGNWTDNARCIAYGLNNHVYASGFSSDSAGSSSDLIVISLDTTGNENWVYRCPGMWATSIAHDMSYGLDNNIYIAGYCRGLYYDFFIVSLDTCGSQRWIYFYNGAMHRFDEAYSLVYGADNNIYAAGYSTGLNYRRDMTVISLDASGNEQWVYKYDTLNSQGHARKITYGADNNIYFAGYCTGAGTGYDFIVISLDPSIGIEEYEIISTEKNDWFTTITSGPLFLPQNKICRVFDITGRIVEPAKIKPGVYFIEVDGKITQKVIKIK